jgi:hypothetical protein
VEEGRLAYRVRTAEAADAAALREAIGATLAHPDAHGRRESYGGAASRGDILLLEHFDRTTHVWQVAGFVECHLRVDDNLSIHDVGTTGDQPQTGVVRYLLDQAFNAFRPVESQVKIRRDATTWLEIFRNIPGFYREGEEYRRPHYWTIWRWNRERAREDEQHAATTRAAGAVSAGPRPPRPPQPPSHGPAPNGQARGGQRPKGPNTRPSQPGPRPRGDSGRPPRSSNPR